jgi:hypothetical protein
MRNFKFLQENTTISEEERAILLREFLGDEDAIEPIGPHQTEPSQVYTQMLRMNVPTNEMTEDYMDEIKMRQERILIDNLMDTFDFRHEIISIDGNGFTLRTELFI